MMVESAPAPKRFCREINFEAQEHRFGWNQYIIIKQDLRGQYRQESLDVVPAEAPALAASGVAK
jgi:hypothetical protein